jgi:hypothetical protein
MQGFRKIIHHAWKAWLWPPAQSGAKFYDVGVGVGIGVGVGFCGGIIGSSTKKPTPIPKGFHA